MQAFAVARSAVRASVFRFKMTGTVKNFNPQKGFGFIIPSDGATDVFVHQTSIQSSGFRSLAIGEEVEFDLTERDGKAVATNVTGPGGADVRGTPPQGRPERDGGDGRGSRRPRGFGSGQY